MSIQLIKFSQDSERAIQILQSVGQWMLDSGLQPSKWWHPDNMNPEFLFQHADPFEFYICLVNDEPAAAFVLQTKPSGNEWDRYPNSAVYVHWVAVARQFAGQGLVEHIFDYADQFARDKGKTALRIDTNAQKTKLRSIYEKLNFKLVKLIEEDYRNTALYEREIV